MPLIQVRDVKLYYEMEGEGEPLLLIHGLGMSTADWKQQVEFFSNRCRVITFDARGHGRSEKPRGPYSIQLMAADAAGLMIALGIAPAHIVGTSMGGMTAFQIAAAAPQFVKSLVIVNSGPEFVVRRTRERLEMVIRQVLIRALGMRGTVQILTRRLFPKKEQEELRRLVAQRWAKNDKESYLAAFNALEGWSVKRSLGHINIPALVVAAEYDYTPVSYKRRWAAKMPNVELTVIPDSRHATPLDQPDRFNRVLETFLAKHARLAPTGANRNDTE